MKTVCTTAVLAVFLYSGLCKIVWSILVLAAALGLRAALHATNEQQNTLLSIEIGQEACMLFKGLFSGRACNCASTAAGHVRCGYEPRSSRSVV